MNLHPVLLAVPIVDALAVGCLGLALVGAVRVELGWEAGSPTAGQLALERRSEEVSAIARVGVVMHLTAAIVLLVALNHVLPGLVAGAMCGVGALQSMPGGTVALAVRFTALAALTVWLTVDALNRRSPTGVLAVASSRTLLIAAPIAFVAAWQTFEAIAGVDVQEPVSCCAAVYDLAARPATDTRGAPASGSAVTIATVVGAAMLTALALWVRRVAATRTPRIVWGSSLVVVAWAWTAAAGWSLVEVFAPYVYGVLGHRCPLCFFSPQHGAVGYPLGAALLVVLGDSVATVTAIAAAAGHHELKGAARRRVRAGGLRIAIAAVAFLALAAGPALVWRLRFGVWIDPF